MARIRSVHPDAMKSEKLAACTAEAERCYWRLLPHCDDEGRAEDHPKLLAAYMFPLVDAADEYAVDDWLAELAALELLVRYTVEGRRFLQVARWGDYQKPQKKQESKLPTPESGSPTVDVRDESGSGPVAVEPVVEGSGGVIGGGEGVSLVTAAIEILAERDAQNVQNPVNPRAVLLACRKARLQDSKPSLVRLSHEHRDWTPLQLADALEPPPVDPWDFSAKAPAGPVLSEDEQYAADIDRLGQAAADRRRELRLSEATA